MARLLSNYMVEARFFSLEEPIQAEGYEIFSQREYYRLVPRPTLLNGHVLERVRVKDGDTLKSGERLEVVLRIEAKNNYEYLVFEDLKPAGLEAPGDFHALPLLGYAMYVPEIRTNSEEISVSVAD